MIGLRVENKKRSKIVSHSDWHNNFSFWVFLYFAEGYERIFKENLDELEFLLMFWLGFSLTSLYYLPQQRECFWIINTIPKIKSVPSVVEHETTLSAKIPTSQKYTTWIMLTFRRLFKHTKARVYQPLMFETRD